MEPFVLAETMNTSTYGYLKTPYEICGGLRRRISDAALISELDDLRKSYRTALRNGGVRILHRGKELSPRVLLNTYLHGEYFHTDLDKRRLIRELDKGDLVPRIAAMEAAVAIAHTAIRLSDIVKRAKKPK